MTNTTETVSSGFAGAFGECITRQLGEGGEAMGRLAGYFAEKGAALAVNIVLSLLILAAGLLAIKLLNIAVKKALQRPGAQRSLLVKFATSVATKTSWVFLGLMVLSRLGIDVAPLLAGVGVTGFILGFAFQESLGNLASGLMIALNEPFKVGETVEAAGYTGTILEVNMMATVMSTADNKRIVLPNKNVWGGPIVNYTALGRRRVDVQIGIAYGADIEKAVAIARTAVAKVPGVLSDPEPAVAVAALDASQVTLNIRPWAAVPDYWSVLSGTLKTVKEDFDRQGVEIPFPQIVVHGVSGRETA